MGTNVISLAVQGQVAPATHHNSLKDAMVGDIVPRNAARAATANAGSLGGSGFPFKQAFITVGYWTAGDIKLHHTYNGAATIDQGWMLCDGSTINATNYDAIHGAGSFAAFIVAFAITGQTPDMRNRYPVGAATTTWDGSSPGQVPTVGNASHQINIAHTHGGIAHSHTVNSHTHSIAQHTHTSPTHIHTSATHTHTIAAHSHVVASHAHTIAQHLHTFSTPDHAHRWHFGGSDTADWGSADSTQTAVKFDDNIDSVGANTGLVTGVAGVEGIIGEELRTEDVIVDESPSTSNTSTAGATSTGLDAPVTSETGIITTSATAVIIDATAVTINTSGAIVTGSTAPGTDSQLSTTDSQLSTTQSIQPQSVEVQYWIRII